MPIIIYYYRFILLSERLIKAQKLLTGCSSPFSMNDARKSHVAACLDGDVGVDCCGEELLFS